MREGAILLVVIGGFCFANKYNRYLDEMDEKAYLEAQQRKKKERLVKTNKMEKIEESSGEEQEEEEVEQASGGGVKKPKYYPLNSKYE